MKCTHDYGQCGVGGNCINCPDQLASQITKREMIAAMAMQGILASLTEDDVDFSCRSIARSALCNADALLAELEKSG